MIEIPCTRCGRVRLYSPSKLRESPKTLCIKCVRHGDTSKLHQIWRGMKQRCSYKGNQNYERYGGRGIKVCNEWIVDYTIFRTWALKNGYQEGLSIERVDNSKGYSPDNCTWIPVNHQSRNRRTSKLDIEKVRHIRKQYSTGKYKQNELAKMYSVTAPMIHVIVRNKKWVNA